MSALWLVLHVTGVVIWVGGMYFAHHCLRPAAAALLPPPQRLPLLAAVLERFFRHVLVALIMIWVSGVAMFLAAGPARPPLAWTVMAGIAFVMTVIFGFVRLKSFPVMVREVAAGNWPAAGAAMNNIRLLVVINLGLGLLTIVVALVGARWP